MGPGSLPSERGRTLGAGARPLPDGILVLDRAAGVELSVFDVTGRAVQRWDYGVLPADDRGRPIASGVHFLRLAAGWDHGMHKVLVLR